MRQRDPRRRARRRRAALVATLATLTLVAPTGSAAADAAPATGTATSTTADDPPFVGWTAALPSLAWQYEPTSEDDCVAGRTSCVRRTIVEMERRLAPLLTDCSHAAVFALAYLRTTEQYLSTSLTTGFYRDPTFVNHQDVVFAELYFDAWDAWSAGDVARVPPAWRIAFRTAQERRVNGVGDLLLGMNAHVNRDLPFALAAIGLVAPDGMSRKLDHDQVNRMLNGVVEPLVAEIADRLDPSVRVPHTPYGVGYTALMQLLQSWRESAWRHAELLAAAPDDAARAVVARAIETEAALNAQAIVAATQYLPPLTSTVGRDRHCAGAAAGG